ncbi:hypothetical protein XTALMG727_2857 [Xanthomonas translucens pv. arrhenatheri LMG 727]|uniref:Uncharacterized protein n=1 Tax=Xanthomonas graminis pv. arrhenatheri LMG 727 TaxID=1195923 RepID=A0A0K2ZVX7_9XANT|nr:hypothetical protein XTALMG727_2857 [Xanthomonas translucens pv. arrhenatheri LMG 727]
MPPRASGRCAGGADARRCRGFQGPFAQRSDRAAPCRRAGMNAHGSVVRHRRQRRRARSPPCRVQRCTASRRAAAAALRPMPPDRHCRAADASAPFARRNALPPRLHGSRAERPRPTVPAAAAHAARTSPAAAKTEFANSPTNPLHDGKMRDGDAGRHGRDVRRPNGYIRTHGPDASPLLDSEPKWQPLSTSTALPVSCTRVMKSLRRALRHLRSSWPRPQRR